MIRVDIQLNLDGEEFADGQGGKVAAYVENALFPMSRLRQLIPEVVQIKSEVTGLRIGCLVVTRLPE